MCLVCGGESDNDVFVFCLFIVGVPEMMMMIMMMLASSLKSLFLGSW